MSAVDSDLVFTMEQEDRAVALAVARELLLVKAGKFAERALDPENMIAIATWILAGAPPVVFTMDTPLSAENVRAIKHAIAVYDQRQGRVA